MPADAFAAKLDPSGSRLIYSTYLGGSADDSGSSVALDRAGNAYYAGFTASPEFPTTPGALKTSLEPGTLLNGYVTKLDPSGRLKWSTYLGGPVRDSAWGIDLDSRDHVYVSGSTIGSVPVTPDAAQTKFGGVRDWFVAKLDRSGASLHRATLPRRQRLRRPLTDAPRRPPRQRRHRGGNRLDRLPDHGERLPKG